MKIRDKVHNSVILFPDFFHLLIYIEVKKNGIKLLNIFCQKLLDVPIVFLYIMKRGENNMELQCGVYTNAMMAEWFGIKEKTF